MTVAIKTLLIFAACLAGAWAATIHARGEETEALDRGFDARGMTTVHYDGPRYEMTEEELEKVRESWRTGADWEKPAGMPVIEVEPGTILDFGGNNTGLTKRSGAHFIGAYSGSNCGGNVMVQVKDFGCGTGCITMSASALSGWVVQEFHANPYPTMDVWSGLACTGTKQHFGVEKTSSCTNSNTNGYKSFIGWYNC